MTGETPTRPAPAPTGFVYDPVFLQHDTGPGFPERPERLEAITRRMAKSGLTNQLVSIAVKPAGTNWIAAAHSVQYIERAFDQCHRAKREPTWLDSRDVPISAASCDVARAAVGGVLAAVDAIMEGRVRNAFCAVRPPGHHALPDRAMGFCIFNHVAIAARYIQRKHGLARVLIVDWDVHHGNGTQTIFEEDDTVMFFSLHQYPFYPGTGAANETGTGAGKGSTINVPLPRGSGTREALEALETKLRPAALAFRPDFVIISCGFDAHENDPLGGTRITTEGFAKMTRVVKTIAETTAQGRLISVLEGGYDLDNLAAASEAHVRTLMEPPAGDARFHPPKENHP